jgi:aspartyl-tRNA synthetase
MNQRAQDLLIGAPGEVEPNQIRDLYLQLKLPKKVEKSNEE